MDELEALRRRAARCTACELRMAHRRPRVVVTLGVTAAKALLGSSFRPTHHRGELLDFEGLPLPATVHPCAVLRAPDDRREGAFEGLVADLALANRTAAAAGTAGD